jgi:monothiol glutaredoxin
VPLHNGRFHTVIRDKVASNQLSIVKEVQAAVAQHAIVVVDMRMNPFPKKARTLLDDAGLVYHYIEYGSYFKLWRERSALKMWTGWPTIPIIFVKGTLVGGADNLKKLLASGEFKTRSTLPNTMCS